MDEGRIFRNKDEIDKVNNNQDLNLNAVQKIQSWLLMHNGFTPNKREDSIYRVFNTQNVPIQIRVSNHGTYLWTWVDKEYDPAHAINISIVVSEGGIVKNKDKDNSEEENSSIDVHTVINKQQRKRDFIVDQFVYDSQILKNRDILSIYNSILNTIKYKKYIDPLKNNNRRAKYDTLKSNYILQENKQIRYKNTNMKRIRLTENQLHRVIKRYSW